MKLGALVAHAGLERGAVLAHAGRERPEVLDGLRDGLSRMRVSLGEPLRAPARDTYAAVEAHDDCAARA